MKLFRKVFLERWKIISLSLLVLGAIIGGVIMTKTTNDVITIKAKKDAKEVKIIIWPGAFFYSIEFNEEGGWDQGFKADNMAGDTGDKMKQWGSFLYDKYTFENHEYYFAGNVNIENEKKLHEVEVTYHTPLGQDNWISNYKE